MDLADSPPNAPGLVPGIDEANASISAEEVAGYLQKDGLVLVTAG